MTEAEVKAAHYVYITDGPLPPNDVTQWRLWTGGAEDKADMIAGLAAHRHMRDRGGTLPGEVYEFAVHVATKKQVDRMGRVENCLRTVFRSRK